MDDIISEVGLNPEMKSKKASSLDIFDIFEIGNVMDDEAIWVNFGVGGPA